MVTTYEFKPEAGVKYSRVTGLAEDLCLAMRAESILIERMAGKSTVGIQVPNHERETIHLRDVLESETFAKAKSRLTLAMGKDINGRIVTADLASMPHVLIAGSTGSGKSVAINAMIMSLLFRTTPSQVRLILVDPKRVELGMYEGIPHLFTPIITEPKLAANALRNAVREMERRLKLLASRSVRNIDQYNKLFEGAMPSLFDDGEDEEPLPYIVIIIDELADLMMLDRSNVEESITRLAQMARAVGIHLILATQRPSVDVITGLIKANIPTRISFRLATKVDSRTILDTNGAEALLGRGDMLFLPPGTSRLMRLHAPYVSEKETAAVVGFWKDQGQAEYVEGFLESPKDETPSVEGSNSDPDENDPMFDDAVRLVFEFGKASTSLLQRRLANWLWPRRAPDRSDGTRRPGRSRRWLPSPRAAEGSGLAPRNFDVARRVEGTMHDPVKAGRRNYDARHRRQIARTHLPRAADRRRSGQPRGDRHPPHPARYTRAHRGRTENHPGRCSIPAPCMPGSSSVGYAVARPQRIGIDCSSSAQLGIGRPSCSSAALPLR